MNLGSGQSNVLDRFKKAQDSLVIQSSDLSLGSLRDMVKSVSIDVSPHYQRRKRWGREKQSALIESFILNVPVPPIYLSEDDFGKYSVIDGKQRLTAITEYLSGDFPLSTLEAFPELSGTYFQNLPSQIQNALSVRPYIRVVTLLRQTDPALKYEVFLRLNTGGERLKPQEIRNVAFSGSFNELIIELSANPFLRERMKIRGEESSAYQNMDDVEEVLRFFATLHGWQSMDGSLASAMDTFMFDNRNASQQIIDKFRTSFNRSIAGCEAIWGEVAFYKPLNNQWREQMIDPLYDAQMVAVASLTDTELARVTKKRNAAIAATREMFESDGSFVKAVSQGTNAASSVKYRVDAMLKTLQAVARS